MFTKSLSLSLFLLTIQVVRAQYGGGGGGGYGVEATGGGGYGKQDAPRQIKLNLGLHVPPIILKMPRMQMPQMTIRANFIRQPYAKPLEINMPPPPQIQFGDDKSQYGGGGGYGAPASMPPSGYGGGAPAPMAPSGGYGDGGSMASTPPSGYGDDAPAPMAPLGGYNGMPSPYGMNANMEVNKVIQLNTDPSLGNHGSQYGSSNPQGYYYPQGSQMSSIPVIEAKSSSVSSDSNPSQVMMAPSQQPIMPMPMPMPMPVPYVPPHLMQPPAGMFMFPYHPKHDGNQQSANNAPPQQGLAPANGYPYPYPIPQGQQSAPMPSGPYMPPRPWNAPPNGPQFEQVQLNHPQRSNN